MEFTYRVNGCPPLPLHENRGIFSENQQDDEEEVVVNGGGGKQRRQSLYRKAPGAPKRFKSSYILFFMEHQKEIKDGLGPNSSIGEVSKRASEVWKKLPAKERAAWDEKAKKDRERYEVEKAAYKGPWQVLNSRRKKDPAAPKRPMSAFLRYSKDKRKSVRDANPHLKNTDVSRLLAEHWNHASHEQKAPYIEQELIDRTAYKEEMAIWKLDEGKRLEEEEQEMIKKEQEMLQQEIIKEEETEMFKGMFKEETTRDISDITPCSTPSSCSISRGEDDADATPPRVEEPFTSRDDAHSYFTVPPPGPSMLQFSQPPDSPESQHSQDSPYPAPYLPMKYYVAPSSQRPYPMNRKFQQQTVYGNNSPNVVSRRGPLLPPSSMCMDRINHDGYHDCPNRGRDLVAGPPTVRRHRVPRRYDNTKPPYAQYMSPNPQDIYPPPTSSSSLSQASHESSVRGMNTNQAFTEEKNQVSTVVSSDFQYGGNGDQGGFPIFSDQNVKQEYSDAEYAKDTSCDFGDISPIPFDSIGKIRGHIERADSNRGGINDLHLYSDNSITGQVYPSDPTPIPTSNYGNYAHPVPQAPLTPPQSRSAPLQEYENQQSQGYAEAHYDSTNDLCPLDYKPGEDNFEPLSFHEFPSTSV